VGRDPASEQWCVLDPSSFISSDTMLFRAEYELQLYMF